MEATNLKFVGEVEKYPELYNYTLPSYSKKDVTRKAWKNVAKEVNMSVNECKEKWRNLRSTFVKNLKPRLTGSGMKKKPYYLMDAMQFAIPFIKVVSNPTGNLSAMSQPTPSLTTSTPDVYETDNTEEGEEELSEDQETSLPAPSPPAIPTPCSSTSQKDRVGSPSSTGKNRGPHGLPVRKRKSIKSDAADEAFVAYFSAKRAKLLSNPLPSKDETKEGRREEGIKNFVLSLIPDLMQLNDVQLRSFKGKALLLIDEVSGNPPHLNQIMQ